MTDNSKLDEATPKDEPPEKSNILLNWLLLLAATAVILLGAVWLTGGFGASQ